MTVSSECGFKYCFEIGVCVVGFLDGEQAVVEAHLGIDGVRGADPMDGAFDLAAGGRAAGFGSRSAVQRSSVISPAASLTTSSHLMM